MTLTTFLGILWFAGHSFPLKTPLSLIYYSENINRITHLWIDTISFHLWKYHFYSFEMWIDFTAEYKINVLVIQFSSLNDLRDFMRAYFDFYLMVPPFEKVTKRRQKKKKKNIFKFVLPCANAFFFFFFVICGHFTTLKWLKVLKSSKICFKTVKAMTPENKRSEHFVSQLTDTIQFTITNP